MIGNGGRTEYQTSTALRGGARCPVTQQALLLDALIYLRDIKRLGIALLR